MCVKSVFESINSIRHNDIVRKAIPHVYDTITVCAISSRPSDCHDGMFEVVIIFDISTNNAVYYSSQSSRHSQLVQT